MESHSPTSAAQLHLQMLQQLPYAQPAMRPSAAGVHAVALAHSRAMAAATAVAASGSAAAEDAHHLLHDGGGGPSGGDASALAPEGPNQRSARQRRQSTSSSGVVSTSGRRNRRRSDLRVQADLPEGGPQGAPTGDSAIASAASSARVPGLEDAALYAGLLSPAVQPSVAPPTSSAQVGAVFRTQSLRRMTATPGSLSNMAAVVNAAMRQHRTSTISRDHSRSPANGFLRVATDREHHGGSVRSTRGSARSFAFTAGGSPLAVSPAMVAEKVFFPSAAEGSGSTPGGRRVSTFSMSSSRAAAEEAHGGMLAAATGGGLASAADDDTQLSSSEPETAEVSAARWASISASAASASAAAAAAPPMHGVSSPMSSRLRPSLKAVAVAAMMGVRGGGRSQLHDGVAGASPLPGSPSLAPLSSSPQRPLSQRVSFSLTPQDSIEGAVGESGDTARAVVTAISGDEADTDSPPPSAAARDVGGIAGGAAAPLHPTSVVRRQSLLTKQGSESQLTDSSAKSPADDRPAEVFLGGACNPTTWRHGIAIPFFEHRGVTYYNPQVGKGWQR